MQRFGRLGKRATLLDPTGDKVIRIPRPPGSLGLPPAGGLALPSATRSLPCSHARMREEPVPADTTGSFPNLRHDDYHHHAINREGGYLVAEVGHF